MGNRWEAREKVACLNILKAVIAINLDVESHSARGRIVAFSRAFSRRLLQSLSLAQCQQRVTGAGIRLGLYYHSGDKYAINLTKKPT